MKKWSILLAVLLLLSIGLAGCGGSKQAQQAPAQSQQPQQQAQTEEKKFTLKIAGIKTDDDPASIAMRLFADEVNKNSKGSIKVQAYTNSVLGNLNDLLTGMTNGTVDMLYNTFSCYSWLEGAKRFTAISAPYLWDDNAELQAFLDSDISKQWMEEAAAASGVRVVIAKGELPPRELTANKAIKTADDFKGVKIRTAEAPIVQETMKRLGATPVVIPFSDLYMALKQGIVDAQENNFITTMTSSFYEVQTHFMKTDYIRDVSAIFISEKIWEELSDNQKQIILAAADKAVNKEAELVAAKNKEAIDFLSTKMTYVEPDIASIKAKLGSDIYKKFDSEGKLWPTGTIDKILEFKASYKR
ncbi:MAG: TRAP transporter substrate-binding protein [Thermoanaerobacteraceae bacterium]|nr:TRAP transporter substrate-binding protein [Thermoanaerobacteraceae bacterium]